MKCILDCQPLDKSYFPRRWMITFLPGDGLLKERDTLTLFELQASLAMADVPHLWDLQDHVLQVWLCDPPGSSLVDVVRGVQNPFNLNRPAGIGSDR